MDYIEVKKYIVLKDRMYTETDEWVKFETEKTVIIGITDYAQKKLRDIIGVDLPEIGRNVSKGEVIATIESVKAVAEVYSPFSGKVVSVNDELKEKPELINKDPYGLGWLVKLEVFDISERDKLLSPEKYAEKIGKE
ncbi:MAG: glycine cleavage system protein GcvH [Sulfolobaceae archaeon]